MNVSGFVSHHATRAILLAARVTGAIVTTLRKRARGDSGKGEIDAILALVVGGVVLYIAFKIISEIVGTGMNNPGGSIPCDLPVKSECP